MSEGKAETNFGEGITAPSEEDRHSGFSDRADALLRWKQPDALISETGKLADTTDDLVAPGSESEKTAIATTGDGIKIIQNAIYGKPAPKKKEKTANSLTVGKTLAAVAGAGALGVAAHGVKKSNAQKRATMLKQAVSVKKVRRAAFMAGLKGKGTETTVRKRSVGRMRGYLNKDWEMAKKTPGHYDSKAGQARKNKYLDTHAPKEHAVEKGFKRGQQARKAAPYVAGAAAVGGGTALALKKRKSKEKTAEEEKKRSGARKALTVGGTAVGAYGGANLGALGGIAAGSKYDKVQRAQAHAKRSNLGKLWSNIKGPSLAETGKTLNRKLNGAAAGAAAGAIGGGALAYKALKKKKAKEKTKEAFIRAVNPTSATSSVNAQSGELVVKTAFSAAGAKALGRKALKFTANNPYATQGAIWGGAGAVAGGLGAGKGNRLKGALIGGATGAAGGVAAGGIAKGLSKFKTANDDRARDALVEGLPAKGLPSLAIDQNIDDLKNSLLGKVDDLKNLRTQLISGDKAKKVRLARPPKELMGKLKEAGLKDAFKRLKDPAALASMGIGAAAGGTGMYLASRPKKSLGGKSSAERDLETLVSAQKARGEEGASFPRRMKNRYVEFSKGLATDFRKSPGAATAMGAISGATAGALAARMLGAGK